jgi:hypothetical protein
VSADTELLSMLREKHLAFKASKAPGAQGAFARGCPSLEQDILSFLEVKKLPLLGVLT